jgi:antitoxin CptB
MSNSSNSDNSNNQTPEMTLAERKVIYRARRGLKELDYYFDSYVREQYLKDDAQQKADFSELIDQEDPDLLDWFMGVTPPPAHLAAAITRLKSFKS